MLEQEVHGRFVAGARRGHQRRLALANGLRDIRAAVEQRAHRIDVAVADSLAAAA